MLTFKYVIIVIEMQFNIYTSHNFKLEFWVLFLMYVQPSKQSTNISDKSCRSHEVYMTIFSSPPCSADYLDGNQEALHCVSDGAVEQVAHRGYGVFILEALQN